MNKAKKWVLTVVLSILWGGLVGFVVGITLEDSKFVTPILVVIGNALIISKIWRASEATSIDEIKKSYSERGGDVTPDIQECSPC